MQDRVSDAAVRFRRRRIRAQSFSSALGAIANDREVPTCLLAACFARSYNTEIALRTRQRVPLWTNLKRSAGDWTKNLRVCGSLSRTIWRRKRKSEPQFSCGKSPKN